MKSLPLRALKLSALAALAALALSAPDAYAQRGGGAINGRVTDEATGNPLPGVTVTVTGPALQGEATEFTAEDGSYQISDLPPGEYLVRFYFADIVLERAGVRLSGGQTLAVNVAVPSEQAKTETIQITERAPTVDVGNNQVQTTVTRELVRRTPNRGRTYESVLQQAPGSSTDDVGNSFNGATGPENSYLISGMNTTNPAYGLVGSQLTLEFIEETEIITGGYQAEYGRATGGIVNVITRSGSNEFEGDLFFGFTPFQLQPERAARLGEAIANERRLRDRELDVGFALGGPIIKDRIWFFVGFHPQYSQQRYDRFIRARTANDLPGDQMDGTYAGDVQGGTPMTDAEEREQRLATCQDWTRDRDEELCTGGGFITEDIAGADRTFQSQSWLFNYIAKLDFRLDDDNRASIEYIGSPSRFSGVFNNPSNPSSLGLGFNTDPAVMGFEETIQVHDVVAHVVSKWLDRKLTFDLFAGYHLERDTVTPDALGPSTLETNETTLAFFEPIGACQEQTIHGVSFNPCPTTNYRYGGFGFYNDITQDRFATSLYVTYLLQLAGSHEWRLGGDLEFNKYRDRRIYTGGGLYDVLAGGEVERQSFGTKDDEGNVLFAEDGFEATTKSDRQMLFLRDAYRPDWLPGLTINAGLRWELEQVKDVDGNTQISLSDNLAPRLGAVYDFTQKGLSKVYASYGRFYEAIPLDIADRAFSKEAILIQTVESCSRDARGRVDATTCDFPDPTPDDAFGGEITQVSPVLKGQYSNEIVAGAEYDIGSELVLGAAFIHRDLGRVIEDISVDGAHTYFIANPGEEADPDAIADLQAEIADLNGRISGETDMAALEELEEQKTAAINKIVLLRGAESFPRPTRDYNALVLTARKRFSENLLLLASYTYSRTVGNYPGLYQASNGQLDPNVSSQYDLVGLLLNREGPLPNDRPHNLKLTGSYFLPLDEEDKREGLLFALTFRAESGIPIEVLGRNPLYGRLETYILPRGSGGRTPMLSSFDLKLGYAVDRVELTWEVFNVFNQRGVTAVDEEFTVDRVLPIPNGTAANLPALKTTTGATPRRNPNYGQPTAYQQPLSMRFGARITF